MNEDLQRKYYLLKELAEDCGRRYRQYSSDIRLTRFLANAWDQSQQAFEAVEREYRAAGLARDKDEAGIAWKA